MLATDKEKQRERKILFLRHNIFEGIFTFFVYIFIYSNGKKVTVVEWYLKCCGYIASKIMFTKQMATYKTKHLHVRLGWWFKLDQKENNKKEEKKETSPRKLIWVFAENLFLFCSLELSHITANLHQTEGAVFTFTACRFI